MQLVNRAWGRIRDFRLWSFNVIADAQLFVPSVVSAGTVSPTFNSNLVTVDVTAAAAINAIALANPPLANSTLGVGRQIRLGSITGISSPTGPNYSIVAWDGISVLTIDKPYGESTATDSPYQILKCYYVPPDLPFGSGNYDQTFVQWLSVVNKFQGYSINPRNLHWTQSALNQIDPQRGGQGDAYIFANYGRNSLGQPVFELYPNPVNFATYTATYVTRWPSLTATQDLPMMPYDLPGCILFFAKKLGADWALANVGTYSELQQTNWVAYAQQQKQEFTESLIQCIKVDDELNPLTQARQQGAGFDFPLGGQFLQGHDVSSLIPN
jgi:hypothetical protein